MCGYPRYRVYVVGVEKSVMVAIARVEIVMMRHREIGNYSTLTKRKLNVSKGSSRKDKKETSRPRVHASVS